MLSNSDAATWARTCDALLPSIHEVDRNATLIWFHFFPLPLAQAFAATDSPERLGRELRLDGNPHLADQCDGSHWFLYGHRFWPHVKDAVLKRAESTRTKAGAALPTSHLELAGVIREIARDAAAAANADEGLLLGITAIGVMTLQQIGSTALMAGSEAPKAGSPLRGTPDEIVAARKKNDSQGWAGILRGIRTQYSVRFDERRPDARFTLINGQHLTTAAANDTRDYSESGPRVRHEGPIPVQCRTASCGTCWVGILGGAEKLSAVDDLEARRMKEFGYVNTSDARPVIRLACMAMASGNVTLVIPSWNGFVGKKELGTPSPA